MNQVNGNTTGIKKHILQRLNDLYLENVPKDALISEGVLSVMAEVTELLNREISIYINRRGMVVDVAVGDSHSVDLSIRKEKRGETGLSGVRCIHTHPSGNAELSQVDISALQLLKLDAMVSCGVLEGKANKLYLSYLLVGDKPGQLNVNVEGPFSPAEVYHKNIMSTIRAFETAANKNLYETQEVTEEKAILIGLDTTRNDRELIEASMDELAQLADTAGVKVVETIIQSKDKPDSKFFIGLGKVRELALKRQTLKADVLIINHELSPLQQRSLEEVVGCKVIDRTELILDIFAQRARTKEGKLQVELAQLNYLLPRLIGQGQSLSRLGGGIGTRGPGETKLEIDRRRIRKRISDLQIEIRKVEKVRNLQRNSRQAVPLPIVALVGYTNAGKSTLLNTLTEADVLAENKLFATLDPITRRLELPSNRTILLTDTVGFIDKIPHHLVAAFRATLEEVVEADLLIHVVDVSQPMMEKHMEAVNKVLYSLGASEKPIIIALNKCDLLTNNEVKALEKQYPNACGISAAKGTGFNELFPLIENLLPLSMTRIQIKIPYKDSRHLGMIHKLSDVKKEKYEEDGIFLEAEVDEINLSRISKLVDVDKEERN